MFPILVMLLNRVARSAFVIVAGALGSGVAIVDRLGEVDGSTCLSEDEEDCEEWKDSAGEGGSGVTGRFSVIAVCSSGEGSVASDR